MFVMFNFVKWIEVFFCLVMVAMETKNDVFAVSMATVVNEKIPLLISESWRGQVFPKCFSPKHNAQSNHYFVKKNCNTSYCSLLLELWTLTTGL